MPKEKALKAQETSQVIPLAAESQPGVGGDRIAPKKGVRVAKRPPEGQGCYDPHDCGIHYIGRRS